MLLGWVFWKLGLGLGLGVDGWKLEFGTGTGIDWDLLGGKEFGLRKDRRRGGRLTWIVGGAEVDLAWELWDLGWGL